jgi:bifunctional ADP-heptose synthase (sugar kinase/adenylyltransferase)
MPLSVVENLAANPSLFAARKVLVVGDIAFDRTFLCRKAREGEHARHADETIFNVVERGDDFGAVGASNNTCVFCTSLGADSLLFTLTGADPEGDRVAEVFAVTRTAVRQLRVQGIQTVTRLRFFTLREGSNRFEMLFRVDKDPDVATSYQKAEELVRDERLLDWFESEAQKSDVILFNDTDKGFLSAGVLAALGRRIRNQKAFRVLHGQGGPLVVVDPKTEWEKYQGLDVDVMKPNHVEACKVLGLPQCDPGSHADLETLGQGLYLRYGKRFANIVVTLGRHGAVVLKGHGSAPSLSLHPPIPPVESPDGAATHCGDMFASALALSLSIENELDAAVEFANYVGSIQYSLPTGLKVSLADVISNRNVLHFKKTLRSPCVISHMICS